MFYYWKVQQMVYRASCKPRKRKEKPSKCQCNAKAIKISFPWYLHVPTLKKLKWYGMLKQTISLQTF